jgi:tetratricopeptide (TPR) repeat protein
LKSYPNSSIWHSCYAEALQRANKMNQMQVELRKAFQLCGLNYRAWAYELNLLREAGNPQKILDFINASNPLMQNTAMAHVLKMSAYAILENQTGFFNELSILEDNFPLDNYAVSVLVPIYSKLGRTSQAEKIIRNYLEHDHTHAEFYGQLVSLANQKGELEKGLSVIREWQKYTPDNVSSSYSAAYMLYADKQYDRALEHVNRALELLPAWAAALNLKGSILTSMGETEKAISVYKETIARTNDDFLAWENLRLLQKQPSLDSLVPLPSIESLIKQSGGWDMKNGESGAILSYITDLFFYPSHCSRERRFLVVYLPNQKAVDQWKEYRVGYNEYYQTGYITRAFSYAPDGTETPADMENGYVVFKSLKPGDYILLEYSIRNYYTGKMAKHVFGTESFQIAYPIYNHQLRFITPVNDTIPFRISGDSLEVSSSINGDYRITSFTRQSGSADKAETFVADDWEGKRQVSYSTLPDWNYVSVWYNELSRGKAGNSIELTHLADSLFTGIDNSLERARRIHEYITTNIRYSYVPFRQSGWIPQSATDVLATRIGDCKDMSSLARYLLEAAGIRARLVLVNTEMRNGITNVPTSPDFNHCIVAFKIDDRQYYMDCTDDCLNFGYLPEMDQGAVALIVDDSTRNLITLPLDSSDNRYVKRITVSEVDTSLTLRVQTSTLRTGVKAAGIRRLYRYISADEQRQKMHSAVAEDYTQMTLDSLKFDDLSTSSDTLRYFYGFTAKNAAMRNGSTISMAIRFVDDVGSRDFPVEEKRSFPIDMSQSAYGIGNFCEEKTIKIPKNWRMLVKPTPVHLESPWGSYHLEFAFDNSVISITRNASFKFYSPVPVSQLDQFKAFMSKIAENDAMQLLFEVK